MDRKILSLTRMAGKFLGFGRIILPIVFILVVASTSFGQQVFVDPSVSTPNDFEFTVDIAIDCGGQPVKGVEVMLAFDPVLLQLNAVTPGPWYSGTGQDFFFFDYTSVDPPGMIHFASSVLDGNNDQDLTIAVCHFTAQGFGSTPLTFQDVDVRSPENLDLGFAHSSGDMVIMDPAVPATETSFGAVKVLFR